MRHVLSGLVLCVALVLGAGCDKNKESGDTQMMSQDACPKCEGVQKMSADGKCPKCGMKADACSHCSGVQTAKDGKCSACGMKL